MQNANVTMVVPDSDQCPSALALESGMGTGASGLLIRPNYATGLTLDCHRLILARAKVRKKAYKRLTINDLLQARNELSLKVERLCKQGIGKSRPLQQWASPRLNTGTSTPPVTVLFTDATSPVATHDAG